MQLDEPSLNLYKKAECNLPQQTIKYNESIQTSNDSILPTEKKNNNNSIIIIGVVIIMIIIAIVYLSKKK